MRVTFSGRSDPGRKRPTNEDAFVTSDEGAYCVLCDGMGGHSSGEIASRMAVELLGERLRGLAGNAAAWGLNSAAARDLARSRLPALVAEWLRVVNLAIYERGAGEPSSAEGRHMGTTLALLCIVSETAVLAHIGDSRIYRLRGRTIQALTRDHAVTAPPMGQAPWPGRKRKYVTRALGTRPHVLPDLQLVDVQPGDRFLLCSDGLTDVVADDEIAEAILARIDELASIPRALINLANERGGRDNITVVAAAVEADPAIESVIYAAPPPLEPPPPWDSAELEELL